MPLIVFEGLDGSGKSSLMSALEQELKAKNTPCLRTREPGGTKLGDEIREIILRTEGASPTPRTELLLYEASRAQHVDEVIRPHLQKKYWILCDRFTASSIAFQAGGRSISEEWVEQLNHFATDGVAADLTVLLDLSVEESRKRRSQRESMSGSRQDRIESEADSFHERVRSSFLAQANQNPDRWLVLDASQTPEVLIEKLKNYIRSLGWQGY